MSVAVEYKILSNKPAATVKVWGYDERGVNNGPAGHVVAINAPKAR